MNADDAFAIIVPPLENLIIEFEKEDFVVQKHYEKINEYEQNCMNNALELERRYEITQFKGDQYQQLDQNITN